MKKRLVAIIILVLVGLISGCGKTDGILKDIEKIISDVETSIEDTMDEFGIDEEQLNDAKSLIPLDSKIKDKANDLGIDIDELYNFIVEQTIWEADSMDKTIPEFLEYLKLNDLSPLLGVENAAGMFDGDISALMDMKKAEKEFTANDTEDDEDLDVDSDDAGYYVNDVALEDINPALIYMNSTPLVKSGYDYTFFCSASINDAKAYYIKLFEGTKNYRIMDMTEDGQGVLIGGTNDDIFVGVAIIPFGETSRVAIKYE